MAQFERYFTLEEASAELPGLQEKLQQIQDLMQQLRQHELEVKRILKLVQSNGAGSNHPEFGYMIHKIQALVKQITQRGVQLKDIERGLIDFPHWRDGREVFLCWMLGEPAIGYWHTLEGGLAGRTSL